MSRPSIRLLQTASDLLGSREALAHRLGIGESTLMRFLEGTWEVPDALLLQIVDIIFAEGTKRSCNDPVSVLPGRDPDADPL